MKQQTIASILTLFLCSNLCTMNSRETLPAKIDPKKHIFLWDIHGVLLDLDIKQVIKNVFTYNGFFNLAYAVLQPSTAYFFIKKGIKNPVWEGLVLKAVKKFPKLEKHKDYLLDFANCMTVKQDVFNVVKKLHDKGFKNYILSNCGPISFETLSSQYPEHFCLFEKVQLPSGPNYTKKHAIDQNGNPVVLQNAVKNFGLKPEQITFVDDSKANIENAKKIGMKTIYFSSVSDFLKAITELNII